MAEIAITIRQLLPWLRQLLPDLTFYNSIVDLSQEFGVGVYARRNGLMQPQSIGAEPSYGISSITLLIRAGKNSGNAQELALSIWQALRAAGTEEEIGDTTAWIQARKEPAFIERDDTGVFTYVVDFEIFYRK